MCYNVSMTKTYTCAYCGDTFTDRRPRTCCSRSCSTKYRIKNGENLSYANNQWRQKRLEDNPSWKGDKVTVHSLHSWVRRNWGSAKECEHCQTSTAKLYDWSMKHLNAKRDRRDWQQLCRGCHMKYDYDNGMRQVYRPTDEVKQKIREGVLRGLEQYKA